jgi:phosphoserine phosphatase
MKQVLLHVSGKDGPGITAAITACIGQADAQILDIEQSVTRGLLSLYFLLSLKPETRPALEASIQTAAKHFALAVNFTEIGSEPEPAPHFERTDRFVVTVIAPSVPAKCIAEITASIAQAGSNIDYIRKLSSGSVAALELICTANQKLNLAAIKERLLTASRNYPGVDVAVQKENLYRRSKRLIVFDMDSTLIQGEVIDELAALVGKKAEVSAITKRAMEGELDFSESLMRRVSMLKGLKVDALEEVAKHMTLTPGAEPLLKALKKLGYRIAIISGGFTYFTERLRNRLGIHYAYANQLEIEDGELTGRVQGVIVDGRRKADLLDLLAQQEGIDLDQVIAIGDGANDMQMLKKAGLGIAFNAKAFTRAAVGTSISDKSMDSILYLLGITDADLKAMNVK